MILFNYIYKCMDTVVSSWTVNGRVVIHSLSSDFFVFVKWNSLYSCFSFFLPLFLSSSIVNQTGISSHYLAFEFQTAQSRCFIKLNISAAEIAVLIICCKLSSEPVASI